ncbi:MAG: GTPase obg [Thermoleophilia bacterium]|nr:GTPase obg [Thermoleophilia bacterium]MCZ4496081.1 GTPase obg [Thermoleophilia bacterium]
MRREAHVPRGGVDGGDGGDGGSVILRVESSRRDLAHLRRKLVYFGEDGGNGNKKKQHGRNGNDLVIPVPAGTQAYDEAGRKLCDLVYPGQEAVVAKSGVGGRGNTHFVSSVKRAPMFAEIGLPGDEFKLEMRLKLMADAALAGLPNAGKSSLLRKISNAKPKVGDYPFTTLAPVLGTIERPDGSQVIVVDVPGLLEGASEGIGMGHEFLAHFERARILVHVISLEDAEHDPESVVRAARVIQGELWKFSPRVAQLPQIIALTKLDLVSEEIAERAKADVSHAMEELAGERGPILDIRALSSATTQGLSKFLSSLFQYAEQYGDGTPVGDVRRPDLQLEEYRVFRPRPKRRRWRIFREKSTFRIAGEPAMRLLAERAAEDEHARERLYDFLEESGALRALKAAGARNGTTVEAFGIPLELWWNADPDDDPYELAEALDVDVANDDV